MEERGGREGGRKRNEGGKKRAMRQRDRVLNEREGEMKVKRKRIFCG